jgi:hypothetical protein
MESALDQEQHNIFQMLQIGQVDKIVSLIKENHFLAYQAVNLILKTLKDAATSTNLIKDCLKTLEELIKLYGIPIVILLNNFEVMVTLNTLVSKGWAKGVKKLLELCFEVFYFDKEQLRITYLAGLCAQMDFQPVITEKKPETAFIRLYKKVHDVLDVCEDVLEGPAQQKERLIGLIKNIIRNEDFENNQLNALEKDLAVYYYNELIGILAKLSPPKDNEPEEQISSPISPNAQNVIPDQSSYSSNCKSRFRTSFVHRERLPEDESQTVEYKKYNWPFNDSLRDTLQRMICSFLNRRGGRIYIGVDDDRVVHGIRLTSDQRDKLKQEILYIVKDFEPNVKNTELINFYFLPIRKPSTSDKNCIPGLFVVKIIVKQGDTSKLYSVTNGHFRAYIRNDGQSANLSAREIVDHIQKRTKAPEEPMPFKEFIDPVPEEIDDIFEKKDGANATISKSYFDKSESYERRINPSQPSIEEQKKNGPSIKNIPKPSEQKQVVNGNGLPKVENAQKGKTWREIAGISPDQEVFTVILKGLPEKWAKYAFTQFIDTYQFKSIVFYNKTKMPDGSSTDKGKVRFLLAEEAEQLVKALNGHKIVDKVISATSFVEK